MSRQSYHGSPCRLCGGRTSGAGFARAAHESSRRHIEAMRANDYPAARIYEAEQRAARQAAARQRAQADRQARVKKRRRSP